MEVDLQPFALELADPLRTADRTIDERTGTLVRVRSGERRGLGEATPLPGWTESRSECRSALERAADRLSGRGPEAALESLAERPAARHGLALALADLRARRLDVPLYRELGRRRAIRHVPVNATLGDGTVEETVAAARTAVSEGFDCLKVKAGARSPETDRERLAAVREAVGDDVDLRVDANEAWDRDTASSATEWLAEAGVALLEQPLPAGDLSGHASIRGGGVDVALDESLASADLDRVLDLDAADALVLKPMVLGGPYRTASVARRARAAGVRPIVSTTVDGVVGRLGAVHVAAALAPIAHCGLATADRLVEDLGPDPAPVADGRIEVPRGSGTGLTLSTD